MESRTKETTLQELTVIMDRMKEDLAAATKHRATSRLSDSQATSAAGSGAGSGTAGEGTQSNASFDPVRVYAVVCDV